MTEYQITCLADLVELRYRQLYPERWADAPSSQFCADNSPGDFGAATHGALPGSAEPSPCPGKGPSSSATSSGGHGSRSL